MEASAEFSLSLSPFWGLDTDTSLVLHAQDVHPYELTKIRLLNVVRDALLPNLNAVPGSRLELWY